ncbi:MAG: iron chelate uptake ABC transporter family permease subunit, partial [Spirochaeta sp.]|nr:iron chelate uptake ABC transporter family permease subunit [Spirochaeta sp.]
MGRYPRPGFISLEALRQNALARNLVLLLRLPRVVTAVLLGAGLGAAGAVMQMLFANPLVEPGLIGVSQGAGFGAVLA